MKILIKRWHIPGTTELRTSVKYSGVRLTRYQATMLLRRINIDGIYEVINGVIRRIGDVE